MNRNEIHLINSYTKKKRKGGKKGEGKRERKGNYHQRAVTFRYRRYNHIPFRVLHNPVRRWARRRAGRRKREKKGGRKGFAALPPLHETLACHSKAATSFCYRSLHAPGGV